MEMEFNALDEFVVLTEHLRGKFVEEVGDDDLGMCELIHVHRTADAHALTRLDLF